MAAYRVHAIVELMRSTGEREFPAQLMGIFFWIAAHDGCKQEDLAKSCNMTPSSVSRCVTWLGPRHRLEHAPASAVRRERDRQLQGLALYLTPKGKCCPSLEDYWNPHLEGNPTCPKQKIPFCL